MKIKTSELEGKALNVAVALALNWELIPVPPDFDGENSGSVLVWPDFPAGAWKFPPRGKMDSNMFVPSYATNWNLTGQFIEKFQIYLSPPHDVYGQRLVNGERRGFHQRVECWTAKVSGAVAQKPKVVDFIPGGCFTGEGSTPIIAVCRAVVAMNLGDEVEVPDELLLGGAE